MIMIDSVTYTQEQLDQHDQEVRDEVERRINPLMQEIHDKVYWQGKRDALDEIEEKLSDVLTQDSFFTWVQCADGNFIKADIWTLDSVLDVLFDTAEGIKYGNKN